MTDLYHKGKWVMETTPTGIRFNKDVPLWRKAHAYVLYIKLKVRDWLDDDLPPTGYA